MKEYQSLGAYAYHTKRRKKKLFGAQRQHLGEMLRELAKHKEGSIGRASELDHLYMCLSITTKHVILNVERYIKGKSMIAQRFGDLEQNFMGEKF